MSRRLHVAPELLRSGLIRISGASFRYLARVLRMQPGDSLELFDGAGTRADARVERIDVQAGVVEIVADAPATAPRPHEVTTTLLCSLLKGDRMEMVIQKATELGVREIVPVIAARSVVRLEGSRVDARLARWRKVAIEAARQCQRADLPELCAPMSFSDAVKGAPECTFRVLLFEGEKSVSLRQALPPERPPAVVVAVGPEGGFEAHEVQIARDAGFAVVGFGPRVLRAETAAIAAMAVVGFAVGDLG